MTNELPVEVKPDDKPACRILAVTFVKREPLEKFAMRLQNAINELVRDGYRVEKEPINPKEYGKSGYMLFGYLAEPQSFGIQAMALPPGLQKMLGLGPRSGNENKLSPKARSWLTTLLEDVPEGTWTAAESKANDLVVKHMKALQPNEMETLAQEYLAEGEHHDQHCGNEEDCRIGATFKKIAEALRANIQSRLS
jgi:hypothetical protein